MADVSRNFPFEQESVLTTNVRQARIARVYVESLLPVATRAGQAEDLGDELDSLVRDVLGQHANVAAFFTSPALTRRSREPILNAALKETASPLLRKFIGVLNQNNRLDLLPAIASAYRERARRTGRPRSRLGPLRGAARRKRTRRTAPHFGPHPRQGTDPRGAGRSRTAGRPDDPGGRPGLRQQREEPTRCAPHSTIADEAAMSLKLNPSEIASVIERQIPTSARSSTSAKSAACWKSATASPASTACPASWPAKWSSSPQPACSGLAFNLEENSVGVIILGDYLKIAEGDEVRTHRRAALRCRSARP